LSPITFILGSILLLPYPNVLGAVAPAYFILGLGYGSTNVTLAAYVGEIATKGQRGTLCAMKQFFFFIGVLIYAAICRFQHRPTSLADETVDFHILVAICVIGLSTASLILTYFVARESPVYLLVHSVHTESYVIFMRSQSLYAETAEVKNEFERLKQMVQADKANKNSVFKDLSLVKGLLLRTIYVLAFNYPLNITTITTASSGFEGNYRLMPFVFAALKVVVSLVAAMTLDAFGRRKHFINSFVVIPILMALSGICLLANITVLPTTVALETATALGLLSVADCFATEIFSTTHKAAGLATLNAFENGLQLILVLVTFAAVDAEPTKVFACIVFFGMAVLIALFNLFHVPETKNLPLPDATAKLANYLSYKF
jgi:Sugar (and other) transporter